MSDTPDRRYEDARMDKLDETVEAIQKDITKIKIKIFNGFSSKIDSTENKVNYIDKQNDKQHGELKDNIKDLSKKFDKILWFFGIGTLTILMKDWVLGLL